jgi:hypothetical protein
LSPQGEGGYNIQLELLRTGQITPEQFIENTGGQQPGQDLGDYRFLENIVVPVDWAMALAVIKIAKERKWDVLENLFKIREDNIGRMVVALAQSGTGNIITAFSHGHLIAMLLEHNYLTRKGSAKSWHDSMAWLTGATTIAEIFGQVAVPSTLVFSAATGEAFSPIGAGALAKILGAVK